MLKKAQLYARRLLAVAGVALALALLGPEDIAEGLAAVTIVIGVIAVAAIPARPLWRRRTRRVSQPTTRRASTSRRATKRA